MPISGRRRRRGRSRGGRLSVEANMRGRRHHLPRRHHLLWGHHLLRGHHLLWGHHLLRGHHLRRCVGLGLRPLETQYDGDLARAEPSFLVLEPTPRLVDTSREHLVQGDGARTYDVVRGQRVAVPHLDVERGLGPVEAEREALHPSRADASIRVRLCSFLIASAALHPHVRVLFTPSLSVAKTHGVHDVHLEPADRHLRLPRDDAARNGLPNSVRVDNGPRAVSDILSDAGVLRSRSRTRGCQIICEGSGTVENHSMKRAATLAKFGDTRTKFSGKRPFRREGKCP